MDEFLPPDNERDMTTTLVTLGLVRAHQEISAAAVKKRLTEHDIRLIEKNLLDAIRATVVAAEEFETFELEKAVAAARKHLEDAFQQARTLRLAKR